MKKLRTGISWVEAMPKALGGAVLLGGSLCAQVLAQVPDVNTASQESLFPTMAVTTSVRQVAGGEQLSLGVVRTVFGGSWMVVQGVQPPAGEQAKVRRLVDFEQERITEVDSAQRTYWSLSFDRYADLLRRYETADVGVPGGPSGPAGSVTGIGSNISNGGEPMRIELVATMSTAEAAQGSSGTKGTAGTGVSINSALVNGAPFNTAQINSQLGTLLATSSLRPTTVAQAGFGPTPANIERWSVQEHVVVGDGFSSSGQGSSGTTTSGRRSESEAARDTGADVWLTDVVRLSAAALDALEKYERVLEIAVLETSATQLVAAARRSSGGLLPVRSESRVFDPYGEVLQYVEETTRLESAEGEIAGFLQIPESFVEVSAPIEALVLRLEQERRLDEIGSEARP